MKTWKIFFPLIVTFGIPAFLYPVAPEKSTYILKEDLRIGVEYGDDNLMFAGISEAELDSEGNIYILDLKNFRIQVFDKDGDFLNSIPLSMGKGPAEVGSFTRMAVLPDGTICLLDFYERKVLLLTKSGEYIRSFKLDFQAQDIVSKTDSLVVLGFNDDHILHEVDLEGRLLASFGEPFPIPSNLSSYKEMVQIRMPMRLDSTASGEIFLLNPFAYEIQVFKDRVQTHSLKGENPFFKPLRIGKANVGQFSVIFPKAHVLKSGSLLLSTIIEIKGLQETIGHLDIFQEDTLRGTLTLKGAPLAVDSQGRIYVSEQEEVPQLVRYSIVSSRSLP